jgi:hypothetical protein
MTWKLARSLQQAATSSGMTLNQTAQAQKQIFLASDVSWFIDPDYYNFTTCECDQVRAAPGSQQLCMILYRATRLLCAQVCTQQGLRLAVIGNRATTISPGQY